MQHRSKVAALDASSNEYSRVGSYELKLVPLRDRLVELNQKVLRF